MYGFNMIPSLLLSLPFLPSALGVALIPRNTSSIACNNSPDLCNRSYSSITHLGAHDSPFLRDASTDNSQSGNQLLNTTLQLDSGVRLLTAQGHNNAGALHLCHSSCDLLDAGPLSTWLTTIRVWLDAHPNDVVTILLVNSDGATAATIHEHFVTSGIQKYTYVPPVTNATIWSPETWPTLQELIAKNTRLVTFVADIDPATTAAANAPYLLNEFDYVFENPFEVTSSSNFTCTPFRPASVQGNVSKAISSHRLSLVNHFLGIPYSLGIVVPDLANAPLTNAIDGPVGNLGDAAEECKTAFGEQPNFLLVDFFDQGNAIDTVDKLNGITPVGRANSKEVAEAAEAQKSVTSAGTGRSQLLRHVTLGTTAYTSVLGILLPLSMLLF